MSLLTNLLRRPDHPTTGDLDLVGDTNVGLVRAQNEDGYLAIGSKHHDTALLAVADGMGGHEFGEVASYLSLRYLLHCWKEFELSGFRNRSDVHDFISTALGAANRHIFHVNKALRIRWAMGTTATVGVIWQGKLVLGHVGDSRCYRLRQGHLRQLTVDHSWQAEMVRLGVLTDKEAALNPLSNMLTNCVGALQHLRVDFSVTNVYPGDRYLFCTDGLSSLVQDPELRTQLAQAANAAAGVRELVSLALRYGGTDNVTAIALFT